MKKILFYSVIVTILNSCYISKTLERDVVVSLDTQFTPVVNNYAVTQFTNRYNNEEYRQAFLDGMMGEFATGHIIVSNENPEFSITIADFSITESSAEEQASDGQVFVVTSLSLTANGLLDKTASDYIGEWSAEKSKSEKVTNNRSGVDVVTGSNKDNSVYRKKTFPDDKAIDLAEKCGRRAGARIINKIVKTLKK